jgi:hypothetical protein
MSFKNNSAAAKAWLRHGAVYACFLVVTCFSFASAQDTDAEKLRLKQAQHTVDLFVERLHQSLDFGAALNDLGAPVDDAMLMAFAAQKQRGTFKDIDLQDGIFPYAMGLGVVDSDLATEISPEEIRRLSIDYLDFFYLSLAVSFTTCKNGDENCFKRHGDQIQAAIDAHSRQVENGEAIHTREELEKHFQLIEAEIRSWRLQLPYNAFDSDVYRENMKQFSRVQAPARRAEQQEKAGTDDETVVIAGKDFFSFWLVERNGQFKILKIGVPWMD